MTPRAMSLQRRVLALVLAAVVAVWATVLALTWRDARHELDELLDGHLAQAAALLVAQSLQDMDEHLDMQAPELHRYAPRVAFQVFHEGRLVLRSAGAPTQPLLAPGGPPSGFHSVRIGGEPWRVFATRGAERDVLVLVGETTDSRASILRAVLRSALAPMLVSLPLLALAVWWAVRSGTAPIRRVGRLLAGREARDLQPLRLRDVPSDLAPLLDALDDLFGRIRGLLESERRFTADAAHELRTPIAAIRAQAQVALAEADPAARRQALQATLDGCDRATRVVEQLLTLARLEAQSLPASAEVDLAQLARQVAADLAPAALRNAQVLELQADARAVVRGDPTLLAVLFRNLVDNAIRYSPAGARIQMALQTAAGEVVLRVEDSGPGLDEGARSRLGERFFRVLGSGASGSGLGWSIVRRIADAHAARVRTGRSPRLGGLCVEVAFAAAAAAA